MKLILFTLLLLPGIVLAGIEVRLSVKFILTPSGLRPESDNFGTQAEVQAEVDYANRVLAATNRGYYLRVIDYYDIKPPPPSGQPSRYWYDLPARENAATFEAASIADKDTWRFHGDAVNIYVNNSGSGQCCGRTIVKTISLGKTIFATGTLLHEVGHLMSLGHTHGPPQDESCVNLTPPLSQYVNDGDGIADTVRDRGCFDCNQLAMATYNGRAFDSLSAGEQAWVNTSWRNVMSYHLEELLTAGQMDAWTDRANGDSQFAVAGRTVFVDKANNCFSTLPPQYSAYAWWVESNPLPQPAWGQSTASDVTVDPPFPPKPPGWVGAWPPAADLPKPPGYPSNWPWPPTDLPSVTFCMGGPRKTVSEGIDQAATGETVLIRSGTYNVGARLSDRVTLRPSRGTVTLRR